MNNEEKEQLVMRQLREVAEKQEENRRAMRKWEEVQAQFCNQRSIARLEEQLERLQAQSGRKMDESLNKKLQNYTLIKCYDAKNNQVTWSIEDNGKRVNDPALQKYLSEIGAYLLEADYAILKVTPKEWATRINNHWKNGMEYFQGGDVPFIFRGFGHVQDYVAHRYEDGTWDALWALGMTAATIRNAMIWEKASGAGSPKNLKNSAQYQKYKNELVKGDVLENSKPIISGSDLKDPKVVSELTKNGSSMSDWAKMESTYSYETSMGKGKIHYYQNLKTGEISFYDVKMKVSIPKDLKIRNGLTDDFWIIDLDNNFIPKGVR